MSGTERPERCPTCGSDPTKGNKAVGSQWDDQIYCANCGTVIGHREGSSKIWRSPVSEVKPPDCQHECGCDGVHLVCKCAKCGDYFRRNPEAAQPPAAAGSEPQQFCQFCEAPMTYQGKGVWCCDNPKCKAPQYAAAGSTSITQRWITRNDLRSRCCDAPMMIGDDDLCTKCGQPTSPVRATAETTEQLWERWPRITTDRWWFKFADFVAAQRVEALSKERNELKQELEDEYSADREIAEVHNKMHEDFEKLESDLAEARAALLLTNYLRCQDSDNLCGTDTWVVGKPCTCACCTIWIAARAALRGISKEETKHEHR